MKTECIHLNPNWNAEPNAPSEKIEIKGEYLSLSFLLNPWAFDGFEEGQKGELRFYGCSKWRLGPTNDEGWYSGQCRFSNLAPHWGEFYEVRGNIPQENNSLEWHKLSGS